MRAFLAVPPDPVWVESARELVARLRPLLGGCAWTRPQAWHLTLKFLGEVTADTASRFASAIAPRAIEALGGSLQTSGSVVFPPQGRARVLGIGFEPGPTLEALARLAATAETEARNAGVPPEKKPWHPHVTLARVREALPSGVLATFSGTVHAWAFPAWRVGACVLYESRLLADGAVHTAVARWAPGLGAAGRPA